MVYFHDTIKPDDASVPQWEMRGSVDTVSLMRWKMHVIPCFPLYILQEIIINSQAQDFDVIRNKEAVFNITQHQTILLLMLSWFLDVFTKHWKRTKITY